MKNQERTEFSPFFAAEVPASLAMQKRKGRKTQRGDVGIAPYAETGSLSRGDRRGRPYSPVYIPVSIGRGDHTHRRTLPEVKVQQSKMLHFLCVLLF